jgi:hypothetical protein
VNDSSPYTADILEHCDGSAGDTRGRPSWEVAVDAASEEQMKLDGCHRWN